MQHDAEHAQPSGERGQHAIELAGARLVLRQHPRRLLLDEAVQAAHAQPDHLERTGDVRAVEQLRRSPGTSASISAASSASGSADGTVPPR